MHSMAQRTGPNRFHRPLRSSCIDMAMSRTPSMNRVSQGGLERVAEQPIPEQFTVTGRCCREVEPSRRTSEQFPLSAPSADRQSATETDREEANSGTYNLGQTQWNEWPLVTVNSQRATAVSSGTWNLCSLTLPYQPYLDNF
ncbi:hypothetical protein EYF80_008239 [Liparis tanakae]|uniref:Uncharacterized protein n=1 Tax=Liparis tanakae TaxID=230148 RepID=A0A4Z2IUP5_9TELE|nr:hypothetical protein EYF80_008239 [Liparis tanakae]